VYYDTYASHMVNFLNMLKLYILHTVKIICICIVRLHLTIVVQSIPLNFLKAVPGVPCTGVQGILMYYKTQFNWSHLIKVISFRRVCVHYSLLVN